jgi:hypothetical protein
MTLNNLPAGMTSSILSQQYGAAFRSILCCALFSAAGCSPWQLAHRTLHTELNEFPRVTDGRLSSRQYCRWAKQEWRKFASEHPEATHSSDYISGFIYGFRSYVYAGGSTDPPSIPPSRYWRIGFRNERGDQAVRDWYEGYSHGALTAKEKGYRDRVTVPSSLQLGFHQKRIASWERGNGRYSATSGGPAGDLGDPFVDDPTPADGQVDRPEQLPESVVTPPEPSPPPPQESTSPDPIPTVPFPNDVFGDVPETTSIQAPPEVEQTFEIGEQPPRPPWSAPAATGDGRQIEKIAQTPEKPNGHLTAAPMPSDPAEKATSTPPVGESSEPSGLSASGVQPSEPLGKKATLGNPKADSRSPTEAQDWQSRR